MVYQFCKSILIDAEAMKYKPSIVMAAVLTASIELYLRIIYEEKVGGTQGQEI